MLIDDISNQLLEGKKDDLKKMFPQFIFDYVESNESGSDATWLKTWLDNEINWAVNNLKKQDRLVWYIKLLRHEVLTQLGGSASKKDDELSKQFTANTQAFLKKNYSG